MVAKHKNGKPPEKKDYKIKQKQDFLYYKTVQLNQQSESDPVPRSKVESWSIKRRSLGRIHYKVWTELNAPIVCFYIGL